MQSTPPTPNRIHPGLTGNPSTPLGMGASAAQICPLNLPHGFPPFLLRELGHELKTPLTGLLGLAQLFRADIKPNSQRQSQYANLIYQKAQQLLVAIYDLMDLSQLSCAQFSLNVEELELASVIQTAWQAAIAQYDEAHLDLVPNLQTEVGWIIADEIRLKQLLIHLISHFLVQVPKGSTLSVRSVEQGDWVVIRCQTEACWLTEHQQFFLSQCYGMEDPAPGAFSDISTHFKLLLTTFLVQLQGGTAFFRSDETVGTEYTILLPKDVTGLRTAAEFPLAVILLSAKTQLADQLYPVCQDENLFFILARTVAEVKVHLPVFQNTCIIVDPQWGDRIGWTEVQTLLHTSRKYVRHVGVLGALPPEAAYLQTYPLEDWTSDPTTPQIRHALQSWKTATETNPESSTPTSPRAVRESAGRDPQLPLTLLQIDSPLENTELKDDLLHQLSSLYRCSIVTADHIEQADLLSRVWSPHVVLGTTPLSAAELRLLADSSLAAYPIVLMGQDAQTLTRSISKTLTLYTYKQSDSGTGNLRQAAQQLYQFLIEIVQS
jgi:hypothetical protein